jgi:hypothetical protein
MAYGCCEIKVSGARGRWPRLESRNNDGAQCKDSAPGSGALEDVGDDNATGDLGLQMDQAGGASQWV